MKPKEPRISVRVNMALKVRIESVTAHTGIDEATIIRNCAEAICDHYEETGQITFPLAVSNKPKKIATSAVVSPRTDLAFNEPSTSYRKTKPSKL